MEIIHNLGILSIKKRVDENIGFLLANKKGGYCSFFNAASSRYYGLFYFDEKTMDMYKFIENIEITGYNDVSTLKNNFHFVERIKNDIVESFLMPKNSNSLIYELSNENEIDLFLDCKKSYDNREFGRYYEISEENGCVIVKFTKKTDAKEDSSHGIGEFILYLAVKSNNNFYEKNDRWIERHYADDKERNSMPFKRHVYNALRLKGSKFVFSMAKSKDDAIKECNYIFNNVNEIKIREKENFLNILKTDSVKKIISSKSISNDIKVAYVNAVNSLNNLVVENKNSYGIFAGLPWFFQFWARDTLVSLKSAYKFNKQLGKKMIFRYLNSINHNGRLPNLIGQHNSRNLGSADAHGWLFFRCKEIADGMEKNRQIINSIKASIKSIKQNKNRKSQRVNDYLKNCSLIIRKKENECHHFIYEIENSLEKSLNGLLKFHTKDNFEVNNRLETWMDTEFENDVREGIRIEMQALRLNMYRLMLELTQNNKYKILENLLKNKIRQKFWNGKALADGLNDFTIRPNIFIAAYAYPELLTNKEWEICFDNALKALWLDWGGLATIDKNNPLFANESTGENIKSYHRGDSWFWINNLAALTMSRINRNKFQKYIKRIIEASTEEILWKGCIGCHSELSDAKELSSKGCFNQAWSNAMFIEMVDGIYK